jgi:Zn-dependent protease with chaperone function
MRWFQLTLLGLALAGPARGEDIVDVLRRSQQTRLDATPLAETLHGRIVVANESLADLPEGARLFVLAHELGHVASDHWQQMGAVYRHWVPGEVTPQTTDPVANALGREASMTSHRQEFEADAYALRVLRRLGRPPQDAFAAFMSTTLQPDTATHPGTRKRIASLRAAQAGVLSGSDAE